MTAAFRAAVIGLGAMGRHHARVLSELPHVELVAVADVSQEQVDQLSQAHNVHCCPDQPAS
jgi:predicted dehydrogenase